MSYTFIEILVNSAGDANVYNDNKVVLKSTGVTAGFISPFAGASIPSGWLACDGSTFSSVTYPALATALGDTWGTHSGTTYHLPDLRGRTLIGAGTGAGLTARTIGQTGGEETHALSNAELPDIELQVDESGNPADGGNDVAGGQETDYYISLGGSSTPFSIMMPWACVNWIVKT